VSARQTTDSDSFEQPRAARRALLTGGAVGLAAVAGSVLGRTQPASAATNPTPDWVNVKDFNAKGDGSTDDTQAILNALATVPTGQNGGGGGGGVLYFPVGNYKTTGTITLAYDQRMVGDGSGSMISYYGSGDAIRQFNPTKPPYSETDFAGGVEDIVIDGSNASAGACGLHIGDGSDYYLNRLRISHFEGAGSIGMHLDDVHGWTEKMTATVQLYRNTTAVVFDVNGSSTPSFMYNDFDFHISANQYTNGAGDHVGMQGITMLNGAQIRNARLKVRGNFFFDSSGDTFSGVSCLDISGTGCLLSGSYVDIAVETDNAVSGQTGWQTIKLGSNNMLNNYGRLIFSDSGWTSSDATLASGQFGLDGVIVNEPSLVAANVYNPASSGAILAGQLICPTASYAPVSLATPSVSSTTLTTFDATNITTGAIIGPPSGNVLVTVSFLGLASTAGQYAAFGLLGHTGGSVHGNVVEARFPSSTAVVPVTLEFLVAVNPGQSYQFDLAGAVNTGSFQINALSQTNKTPTLGAGGAGGPVVMAVAAA
jgi:Pectate lyase superfamily protein